MTCVLLCRYTVKEADNRLYGMLREDGTWSGMIGELVNKSVDMGVGDLSWTLDRSTAADLTSPVFPETVTFIYRAPGFYSRTWILFQDIDFRAAEFKHCRKSLEVDERSGRPNTATTNENITKVPKMGPQC
ncbi:lig_chan-Glu_bd domain-containing protein [Trichonephila clavipes]|nr:lig_chan-Glu_bd domain-containing protein [Trichonephila clavipes]